MSRPINCDQVAWMLDAIRRYLPKNNHPRISRERDVLSYGLLYEIMEVACLHFEDEGAAHNATPRDVFTLRPKGVEGISKTEGIMLAGGANQARELGELMKEQARSRMTPKPMA